METNTMQTADIDALRAGMSKEELEQVDEFVKHARPAPDYDKLAEDIYQGRYASIDQQLDEYARNEIEKRIMAKILKENKAKKDALRAKRKAAKNGRKKAQKR